MHGKNILCILLFILILYFFSQIISYYNVETFEQFEDYDKPLLTNVITENGCLPPKKDCEYSYQVNRNFCTTDLFCPNKDDLCVNQHCVPQGIPPSNKILEQCDGCAPPGLISQK